MEIYNSILTLIFIYNSSYFEHDKCLAHAGLGEEYQGFETFTLPRVTKEEIIFAFNDMAEATFHFLENSPSLGISNNAKQELKPWINRRCFLEAPYSCRQHNRAFSALDTSSRTTKMIIEQLKSHISLRHHE